MNPLRSKPASTASDAVVPAKAYCGPAHGQSWNTDSGRPLPLQVHLDVAGRAHCYQLVRDLRMRRPARDHHGDYLSMPAGNAPAPAASTASLDPLSTSSRAPTAGCGGQRHPSTNVHTAER